MAGLEIDEQDPGYKHIVIQPQPGGGFTRARASHQSLYGKVSSGWEIKDGEFVLSIEIPANTRATVRLPETRSETVKESGQPLAKGNGITGFRDEENAVVVEVGSGNYRFSYPRK
jgi:alpha-L-rhamnosidase